ncbi:MAG: hypothetical protein GY703_24655 [Gammaproteobacteria bacterium]|nr:hypothetical protein [Gammaproteobacteria bacterium]
MTAPADFNPFIGLRPFERADSRCYFGRDTQIRRLLERLVQERFLSVVGSAGCGKSSLVRAGLIPALDKVSPTPGGGCWRTAVMQPGESPLRHLAVALLSLSGETASRNSAIGAEAGAGRRVETQHLASRLSNGDVNTALDVLRAESEVAPFSLFLFVDQFEDLFRYRPVEKNSPQKEETGVFISLLLQLVEQNKLPVHVGITLRPEYLGDWGAFAGLHEAIADGLFPVSSLTGDQLRECIEGPVRLAGGSIAPRLVSRMVGEYLEIRNELSVIQHLLMRIWNHWAADPDGPLDLDHFEEAGGIEGALDQHAETVFLGMSRDDRSIARCLFKRCTELDRKNKIQRRPAHLREVWAVSRAPMEQVIQVIEQFQTKDRFFLILSTEDPANDPFIDIPNESLLHHWKAIHDWVEAEADDAEIYRHLCETARLHAAARAELYRDKDLKRALAWKQDKQIGSDWADRYPGNFEQAMGFLQKSQQAPSDEQQVKERAAAERAQSLERQRLLECEQSLRQRVERAERKADTAEQKRALSERLSRRKSRRWTMETAGLGMSALVLLGVTGYHWNESSRQAGLALEATARALAAEKTLDLERIKADAQGVRAEDSLREFQAQAADAAEQQQQAEARRRTAEEQTRLVNQRLQRVEVRAGLLEQQKDRVEQQLLAASLVLNRFHQEKAIEILSEPQQGLDTGAYRRALLHALEAQRQQIGGEPALASSVRSTLLSAGLENGFGHGVTPLVAEGGRSNNAVIFSPAGRLLASASSDGNLYLRATDSGAVLGTLKGHENAVNGAVFSPDGRQLASASWDRSVRLWNPSTGVSLLTLEGEQGVVNTVAFSPDGRFLASGSWDSNLYLWDPDTGRLLKTLEGHQGVVNAVAFSPDGHTLASASDDTSLRLWNLSTGDKTRVLEGHEAAVHGLAFSPDGRLLASASADRRVHLWDLATGSVLRTFDGHQGRVLSVAFSPDGHQLASASGDRNVRLWDSATGESIGILEGHRGAVQSVAFSPDGQLLASVSGYDGLGRLLRYSSMENSLRLWDLRILSLLQNGPAPSFRAAVISEALQRLWGVSLDDPDLNSDHRGGVSERGNRSMDQTFELGVGDGEPQRGRVFDIGPLLDPPEPGKDRLDQFLRWLVNQGV